MPIVILAHDLTLTQAVQKILKKWQQIKGPEYQYTFSKPILNYSDVASLVLHFLLKQNELMN